MTKIQELLENMRKSIDDNTLTNPRIVFERLEKSLMVAVDHFEFLGCDCAPPEMVCLRCKMLATIEASLQGDRS